MSSCVCPNLIHRLVTFTHFPQILYNTFFNDGILLLRPPFRNLRQAFLSEMVFEGLGVALAGREECEQIFDTSALQSARKVVHGLINEVGTKDKSDYSDRYICRTINI